MGLTLGWRPASALDNPCPGSTRVDFTAWLLLQKDVDHCPHCGHYTLRTTEGMVPHEPKPKPVGGEEGMNGYLTPLPESEVQSVIQRLKRAGWFRDGYRDNQGTGPTTWYLFGHGFVAHHVPLEAARAIATLGIALPDGRVAPPPLDP